jgi:type IV pilus assembly protein PilE
MAAPALTRSSRPHGFTLIEVMITVAIVGILAAVALPAYNDYLRRSELPEAFSHLSSYRIALEQYYQDNRHYGLNTCTEGRQHFDTSADATAKFTYTCDLGGATDRGAQSYTLKAVGTSPHTRGHTFTINHVGDKSTTVFKGQDVSGRACWLRRGNEC